MTLAVVGILLLANSITFFRNFSYLGKTETGFRAVLLGTQEFAAIAIFFFVMVSLFSFSPRAFKIWVGVLFVTTFITIYFVINYGVRINYMILKNVSATQGEEIAELLDTNFFFYLGAGIGAALLFYNLGKLPVVHRVLALRGWPWGPAEPRAILREAWEWLKFMAIAVTILLAFIATMQSLGSHYRKFAKRGLGDFSPLNVGMASLVYAKKSIRSRNVKIRDISGHFVRTNNPGGGPLTIVLVIGESARADRFSLNGYDRKTNPNLSRIEHLFSFRQASTCDTSTVVSVPCILARQMGVDFSLPLRETSLVGILRHLGFATFWYSLQYNSVAIDLQCQEAKICRDHLPGEYDTSLLTYLDKALESSGNQNVFIVLHTMGSHTSYILRTPGDMAKFTPVCSKSAYACEKNQLDNTYDNSILFTDHFLNRVIKRLSGRNAFMIYTSDHGESLGEAGILSKSYGHSTPTFIAPAAQTHVPMMFWTSKVFLNSGHRQVPQAAARRLDKPVSHDNVFHSVLDCAGVRSRFIIESLSFCR